MSVEYMYMYVALELVLPTANVPISLNRLKLLLSSAYNQVQDFGQWSPIGQQWLVYDFKKKSFVFKFYCIGLVFVM